MNNKQILKPAIRMAFMLILLLNCLHIHAYTKTNMSIYVNGVQRNMIVFTPDGVTSGLPLMIVTHGMGQDPTYQYEGDRLYQLIDTERFIIAYLASNGSMWDTGGNGDLDFIDAVINKMDEMYQINRNRLYWSGFSMGSMLIYHGIRSEIGKKFAAFAPCSGILFYNQPWAQRDRPVNLIHCHAYGDEVFPYNSCEGKYDYSIRDYVTNFATILNQNANYTKTTGVKPNEADFWWVDGDKEVWSGGPRGGEVELFSANSGGHWPTGAYMYEIWNFCKRFSLNGQDTPQGEAKVTKPYSVGDDIANYAPTSWAGQTGTFEGMNHPVAERYKHGGDNGAGDVLTQTLTGLKNGVYAVTLEVAATFTSGRGFDCPTGNGLSVAFANGTNENLEVVDRNWVTALTPVTIYATVSDGTLKYGIQNLQNSGNWYLANVTSIKYVSDSNISYGLNVSSAGVATLYLPYNTTLPDADFFVAATVKDLVDGTAILKEVHDVIPAKTGVIIFANAGNYSLPLSATSSTENCESLLHGVLEDTPVSTLEALEGKSIYVLSRGIKEYTGFKKAGGSVTSIPAYRAYLPYNTSSDANIITFSFDDSATAIGKVLMPVDNGQRTTDEGQWYTIDGRRLNAKPTQCGIYIVNGKKVMYRP